MKHIVAAIQMTSTSSLEKNLAVASELIGRAAQQGAKLIVLPENFAIMGRTDFDKVALREKSGKGPIQDFLATQALTHNIWIVGGTIPLEAVDPHKVRAACLVYNNHGKEVARYDKIHLFDVTVSENEAYQESASMEPGNNIVVIDTPFGKLGLTVCYDIRFPELFRALLDRGAEIITISAAFTVPTGTAHWELLARARAVENLCYVIGACQVGKHDNDRETYGHSLVVEPWGNIIALQSKAEPSFITAEIDLEYLHKKRILVPINKHRKLYTGMR
ncbi:MAG: 2-oxoglutaramate amidase [Gammaproteobacteria bacterium]|nr:2-oxoglutaramate amidase [Gammaproteobacteria bacterium]